MPQTIEHRIRVLNRPATPPYTTPPYSSPSSTVDRRRRGDDQSWSEQKPRRGVEPIRNGGHKRTKSYEGGEETYGVESFERNLRYSPNEIQRQHFSVRTFGDRQTLMPPTTGADRENNRGTVKFEDDQRMHRPSRRSDCTTDDHRLTDPDHVLVRSPHLDTTPVRIPRARIDRSGRNGPEERSIPTPSPTEFLTNVPLKKVIRKARLVSIHDGRPMGPFVETVHYEPMVPQGTAEHEWRTTSSSTRRTTREMSPKHVQLFGHSPELWTSSSSCSLSSNEDEREGEHQKRGGKELEEVRGRRFRRPVMVQHNPLRLYEADGRR